MHLFYIILGIWNINVCGSTGECQLEESFISGHYYVVGLYKMYTDYDKSEYDENAIRLHLKLRYFTETEYYYNVGPSIGYHGVNICNHSSMVESLTNVLLDPFFKPDQTVIKDTAESCDCRTCKCGTYSSNILAIFLYLSFDITVAAINILIAEKMSVFSFLRKELPFSNDINMEQQDYPYNNGMFSSYRLGKLFLISTMKRMNIKNLALVNIGNFASKLALYHQELVWENAKKKREICIQQKYIDPLNYTDITNYMEYIRSDQSLQMIVVWSHGDDMPRIMEHSLNITSKIWLWYTDQDTFTQKTFIRSKTHFFALHPEYAYQRFNKLYSYRNMSSHMYEEGFERITNDLWISGYRKKLNLTIGPQIFNFFDNKTTLDHLYIQAMVRIPWYTFEFSSFNFDLNSFWDWIRLYASTATTLPPANSKEGSKWINRTNICNIMHCHPGYEPKYQVFHDSELDVKKLKWHCVKCPLNSIKLNYNLEKCQKCRMYMKSDLNRTKCLDPYADVYTSLNAPLSIILLVLIGGAVVFNLSAMLIFIRYKNTPIIRACGFTSRIIQLSAHLLLFIGLLACSLVKPTQILCIIQPIVIGTLLTVISAITITSTFKALHAFNSSLVLSKRSIRITKMTEWFVSILLIAIQMGICGITLFQDLPTVKFQLEEVSLIRNLYCINQSHLRIQIAWNLLLSLYGLMQAFKGRNLPGRFNESKQTLYSMLLTILILTISFPISLSQTAKQDEVMVMHLSIATINLVQLLLTCSYRIFIIIFRPQQNTKEVFRNAMMKNAKKKAAQELKLRNLNPVDFVHIIPIQKK